MTGAKGKRNNVCRKSGGGSGGAEGDRTPDLVIANDALSHLSYGPSGACLTRGGREVKRLLSGFHAGFRAQECLDLLCGHCAGLAGQLAAGAEGDQQRDAANAVIG